MPELILGAAVGAAVCLLGIWAFLKGQSSMMGIRLGEKPALRNPFAHRSSDAQTGEDDIPRQLRSLFSDPKARP